MAAVRGPMHGVDFSEMTFEGSAYFHGYPRELFKVGCNDFHWIVLEY